MRKWVREVKRLAEEHGWRLRRKRTGKGHLILTNGESQLTTSLTPSDNQRTLKNLRSYLRRDESYRNG